MSVMHNTDFFFPDFKTIIKYPPTNGNMLINKLQGQKCTSILY